MATKYFHFDGFWGVGDGIQGVAARTTRLIKVDIRFDMTMEDVSKVIHNQVLQIEEESWQAIKNDSFVVKFGVKKEQCCWRVQTIVPLN